MRLQRENYTSPLNNLHIIVLAKTLSRPARSIRVRIVVAIEDGNYDSLEIKWKEVIDIICLRRRIRDLHHAEARVGGNKAVQAFLQLDRRLRRIVGNVDAEYVGGPNFWLI